MPLLCLLHNPTHKNRLDKGAKPGVTHQIDYGFLFAPLAGYTIARPCRPCLSVLLRYVPFYSAVYKKISAGVHSSSAFVPPLQLIYSSCDLMSAGTVPSQTYEFFKTNSL